MLGLCLCKVCIFVLVMDLVSEYLVFMFGIRIVFFGFRIFEVFVIKCMLY